MFDLDGREQFQQFFERYRKGDNKFNRRTCL